MIALSIGLGFVFGDVLPRMIGWVNAQYHLSLLTGYSPHLKMFVMMTVISLILILLLRQWTERSSRWKMLRIRHLHPKQWETVLQSN